MNPLQALQSFHFLRPAWLLALLPLWLLTLWLARQRRAGSWTRLIDAELLPDLRLDAGGRPGASPWPWLALAWSLAALGLAGPSWQRDTTAAYRAPAAWVLVLDLSPSMNAADLAPNRYTRARYALDDLLGAARDVRVGLVVFSDEAYTVSPLTDDVATVRALLPPLAPGIMPSGGERLAPALQRAADLLEPAAGRNRRVVVLTDGFSDPAGAFAAAARLRAGGATVDVVGIGSREGAPLSDSGGGFSSDAQGRTRMTRLDADLLQQLAAAGGGRYVDLDTLPALLGDLRSRPQPESGTVQAADVTVTRWRDGGIWVLPALLFLAALLWRRGWL